MSENIKQAAWKILKNLVIITRAWSFTITFVSVTLGTALAADDGRISFALYALTLFSAIVIHAAANMLNDYFDLKNKVDTPQAPTALYRPHPVFANILTPKEQLAFCVSLLALALIIGSFFAIFISPLIWLLLVCGFLLAVFYTATTKGLKYIALGELAVFTAFGPLLVEGAYCIQRAGLSFKTFLISIPTGLFVALVLLANNIRDVKFDAASDIKTLCILLGKKCGLKLYALVSLLPYILVVLFIGTGVLKWTSAIVFLVLPLNIKLAKLFFKDMPQDADARTSQIAFLFGLLLIGSIAFL